MKPKQISKESPFVDLGLTVKSTLALLNEFETSLNAHPPKAQKKPQDPPNILNLVGDSAKLLKAQVTKLSLLVLNKPFSPTAITRILGEISRGCLPGLMTAADLVTEKEDGHVLFHNIRGPIRGLFRQMVDLILQVPLHESDVDSVEKTDGGTLASTGMVWETCDRLVRMSNTGLVGIIVQQAQEYRDLLQDAISELKEWTEGAKGPGSDLPDPFQDIPEMRQYGLDAWAENLEGDATGHTGVSGKNDPILRTQVEQIVKTLQRVDLIYPPIIKRRLKRFPAVPGSTPPCSEQTQLQLLDSTMNTLKLIPEEVDELAAACYQGDLEEMRSQLANVCERAVKTMQGLSLTWQAEPDEFTEWSKKWVETLGLSQ